MDDNKILLLSSIYPAYIIPSISHANHMTDFQHFHMYLDSINIAFKLLLVFESPVLGLEKDWDWTAPGPVRTAKDHNRSLVCGPS